MADGKRGADTVTLKIPRPLYENLQTIIQGTGFRSVTEFAIYVLRDLASSGPLQSDALPPGPTAPARNAGPRSQAPASGLEVAPGSANPLAAPLSAASRAAAPGPIPHYGPSASHPGYGPAHGPGQGPGQGPAPGPSPGLETPDADRLTPEEVELIRRRLRSLGYL